jgi:hypothetical protein
MAAGEASAAPRPCTARPAISCGSAVASPQATDPAVNSAMPVQNTGSRPSRSAARPPSIRQPPKTSVYALTSHAGPAADSRRCSAIDGIATFTIVPSMTIISWAEQTSAMPTSEGPASEALTAEESARAAPPTRCPRTGLIPQCGH